MLKKYFDSKNMDWGFSKVNFRFEAVLCLTFLIILSLWQVLMQLDSFSIEMILQKSMLDICIQVWNRFKSLLISDILKDFMYHSNIFLKITDATSILEVYFSKWLKSILQIHIFSRWNSVAPIFKKGSKSIFFQFRFSSNTLKRLCGFFICFFFLCYGFESLKENHMELTQTNHV